MTSLRGVLVLVVGGLVCLAAGQSAAQSPDTEAPEWTIEMSPDRLTLEVGEKATLVATVRDADGAVVDDATVV